MIDFDLIKTCVKHVRQANGRLVGRDERIAAKKKEAEELFAASKDAKDANELSEITRKLNRANGVVDRMTDVGHEHAEDLKEALDKLIESATAERAKLK